MTNAQQSGDANRQKARSLNSLLSLISLGVFAALCLGSALVNKSTFEAVSEEEARERIALLAQTINFAFETMIDRNDLPALQRLVENVGSNPAVRRLTIVDRDLAILADKLMTSDRAGQQQWILAHQKELMSRALQGERQIRDEQDADGTAVLTVALPLRGGRYFPEFHSDIVGVIRLSYDLGPFRAAARRNTITTIVSQCVTLLAVILVLNLLARCFVLKPIRAIAQASRQLAEGDLTARVTVTSRTEIGELGGAFNAMAGRLQELVCRREEASGSIARAAALQESNATLQAEIAERKQTEQRLRESQADLEAQRLAALNLAADAEEARNRAEQNYQAALHANDALQREITERERAAAALRRSEEFNRSLIDSSQDCIKTLDLKGHLLSMSSGGQRLLDITDLGPLLQKSWIDFWKEEDRPGIAEAVAAAATGGGGRFQASCPSRSGRPRWWDVIVSPVFGADGQIERLLSVSRDITEQKQAEERISQLNAELERRVHERTAALEVANARTQRDSALIATINEALAQFITDERSQDVFETLLRNLLKLTASEYGFIDEMAQTPDGQPYLTALAITNIAWDDESRALYAKFRAGELRWTNVNSLFGAVMTSGEPVIANDAPNDPRRGGIPSGHPALNRFLGLPLHYGEQMVGVIGLANAPDGFSDQSVAYLEPIVNASASMIAALKGNRRRQQAEEELQQRVAQVQAANKELEAFSYSVSHDLRAPLRAIDGFSRILLEDYAAHLPEDGQRYLRLARENTQRMGQLIDDLLAFSRLGRQQMQKKSIAPTALVRGVLADLQDETAKREVEVILGELPSCQADPALLKQVFVNLLANAFKFTRAQPAARIEIGCRNGDPSGQNTYFVKDNGAGFDMQYVHKLFGVFQRLHRAEDYPGTGVGLAIVQRIIHRHGGRVWAEGAVNQGATFYFTLSQGGDS